MRIITIPEGDGLRYSNAYDQERRGASKEIDVCDGPNYIELYDCNGEPLFRSRRIGYGAD